MIRDERETRVDLARILSAIDCFEDKLENDRLVIESNPILTEEERQIIANDYRAAIGKKRHGIRVLTAIMEQQKTRGSLDRCQKLEECKAIAAASLQAIADEFLGLIDKYLLPASHTNVKSTIFYLKNKGDFLRYRCECCGESEVKRIAPEADKCYKAAIRLHNEHVKSPTGMSLALALNYSIFLCEVMNRKKDAIQLARQTLDESAVFSNDGPEDEVLEAANIQEMLRKNIASWTRDDE